VQREVQAAQAAAHLPALLDAVERGETMVIMRLGRVIARLVPEPSAVGGDALPSAIAWGKRPVLSTLQCSDFDPVAEQDDKSASPPTCNCSQCIAAGFAVAR
jgi:antitoxin (DNA-binding transcriptional repressor) of toxin-antitoxin stability system